MELVEPASDLKPASEPFQWRPFLRRRAPELLLLVILIVGAWLRFRGRNWDESQHLHPDERFLTMVETSIRIPASLGEYFNTEASPLNPNNAGHTFFVYGTLPIFLLRFLAEWTSNTGYDEVVLLGRSLSAAFDLLTILFVYLIGSRLYSRRVGLLAAALTAFSVLLIQHAHFFVVESFTVAFVSGGFYFAIRAMDTGSWADHALFGLFLGMAAASKIDAITLAAVPVLGALVRLVGVPGERRLEEAGWALLKLWAAALVALLAFRVFQPYAFAGTSFFSLKPNPDWLTGLAELRRQASGTVDFPPALQWADRTPVLFAWKNMVLWGMGLPLGLAAWAAWAWAIVRIVRSRWLHTLLPVVWIGGYFLWRSVGFTPSMRYQLPIYPLLAILAAWGLWEAWDAAGRAAPNRRRVLRPLAGAVGLLVLLGTAGWAFAFAGIYTRPMPRVEATRWIYSYVPAVVNILVGEEGQTVLDPIPVALDLTLGSDEPVHFDFIDNLPGNARAILTPTIIDLTPELGPRTLTIRIQDNPDPASLLAMAVYTGPLPTAPGERLEIPFDLQPPFYPGHTYYANLSLAGGGAVILRGDLEIRVTAEGIGDQGQAIGLPRETLSLSPSSPYEAAFNSRFEGPARGVLLPHVSDPTGSGGERVVVATLLQDVGNGPEPIARASYAGLVGAEESSLELVFEQPVMLSPGGAYVLRLEAQGSGALAMRGSVIVNESTWDDGLPLRLAGLDINGRYAAPLLELYWPDDQDADQSGVSDKLERLVTNLSRGDLLAISSNRQYGTISRVPIRYPLTTAYYRALFDCPEPQSVVACGGRATPQAPNALGWQLIAVFENNPRLGPIEINDQLAEEAFTVYDHPRVLIFSRSPSFSAAEVEALLGAVDLSHVVHLLPGEVGRASRPAPTLMLPEDRWDAQRAGGTWSEAFHPASLLNRYPFFGVIAWWLAIAVLGAVALPITRVAFPGLADGGYPLARIVGLVIVAWGAWMLGSVEVPFGRGSILLVLFAMAGLSLALARRDRLELKSFLASRRKEILFTEALALGFFLLDLGIRLGNPDIWHPSKGGEKPMDLSYLTAVLRSTSFPPYDPWFSGGYINYYYYGFVLIGLPMRLLGIMPTIGYNLAIPTLFALLALAAYCAAYNLAARFVPPEGAAFRVLSPRVAGVAAAVSIVVLGNLGTARMIYEGLKRIGTPEGQETGTGLVGVVHAARGAGRFATLDVGLPYALDSWYWDPSRVIPHPDTEAVPITEFPFFTFLYSDLHAHMISRPVAVLCLAWMVSWLLAADRRKHLRVVDIGLSLAVGGLAFGALRPTNLGDYPTYWAMGAVAAAAAPWLRRRVHSLEDALWNVAETAVYAGLLLGFTYLLYAPYYAWYGQAYGEIQQWTGSRTPLWAYLIIHGLPLFAILSWVVMETIQWMASTPLSTLKKLQPYLGVIGTALLVLVAATVFLAVRGYVVAILVIPTAAWAGVLMLRPGQPLEKRLVLTLYAAGAALTLLVEIVVAVGDISRMNTVFKFYLQVWELFGVAGAAALFWLLSATPSWRPTLRQVWTAAFGVLVFSAALYPIMASIAKIRDRWEPDAPHSLNGIAFMPSVTYHDIGSTTLEEDAAAIQWLQEEVEGTPVIVEAHIPEYRWGSRMTIYTGLPSVLGWNWHQRQQRVLEGDMEVWERAWDIEDFYLTRSIDEAQAFLEEYEVGYVIAGALERMYYESLYPCTPFENGVACDMSGRIVMRDCSSACVFEIPPEECTALDPQVDLPTLSCPSGGLEKFEQMAQMGLLRLAFREGQTAIYEVVR